MAQEPGSRKKPPANTLAALMAELGRIDREILKALNLRARRTRELLRADPSSDIARASGETETRLDDLIARNKGPLGGACVRTIFRELASDVRAQEQPLRVAFLGPSYSYSHVATLQRFGSSGDLLPVASIAAVFEEVNRGQAQFGVVPLENSTDGRVADTLDMFTRLRVRICGEVPLRIRHHLLGRCQRSEVTEVYSKPQALSQ
ncbi:MAG TPA: prephenate dehydratase domain-containing protein, partial [Pirellulales bacterium]|nr:prephenate dehydratase domain-containing protein [Pirellulales bacterium]